MVSLSALCHHCLVQFVLLVLPMNLFSVVPISVFLFPMFALSFCFMSSLSGPVCTLSVANKQIFVFLTFVWLFLHSRRHLSKFNGNGWKFVFCFLLMMISRYNSLTLVLPCWDSAEWMSHNFKLAHLWGLWACSALISCFTMGNFVWNILVN